LFNSINCAISSGFLVNILGLQDLSFKKISKAVPVTELDHITENIELSFRNIYYNFLQNWVFENLPKVCAPQTEHNFMTAQLAGT
jgi:hypothetical protein